ncbi:MULTISPECIES: DUF4231 domain-containing protein [unclassified Streptomyces]|uniref:DUF4231 domain-containing protein n=1 Tax=Streptomyces sp. NPDC056486 TaxID=3345835 RepID=UPI00367DB782
MEVGGRGPIPDRVQGHLRFFEDGAASCKRNASRVDLAVIILAAAIPAAAAFRVPGYYLALLGAAVVIVQSLGRNFQWKENWIRETAVLMAIQQEVVWFDHLIPPYGGGPDDDARRSLLVARVETIVQEDAARWVGRMAECTADKRGADETS